MGDVAALPEPVLKECLDEQQWERRFTLTGDDANSLWNRINADPTDPTFVYISGIDFLVSTDGGSTFNLVPGPQPHGDHHGFAANPVAPQIIYVVCDGGIYRSSNRGATGTWQFIGDGISNVMFYDIALAATDPTLTIGGNAGQRYPAIHRWYGVG
jgi:hypothetical protein